MTPKFFILIAFLLLGISTQAQTLAIDDNLEKAYIQHLEIFNDSTKSRSLAEITGLYRQQKFRHTKLYAEIAGVGNFDYWFVLQANNESKQATDVVFEVHVTRLSSFSVYSLENDSLHFEGICGGINTDLYDKPLWSYGHAVKLTFKPQEQKTLFFKTNKLRGSVKASVLAYSPKAFDKNQRNINSLLSFMLGIGCIVFITSCMLGFFQRNYAYFVFAILACLRICQNLQLFNYSHFLNSIGFGRISSSMVLLISLMFQYQFFKLFFKEKNPRWLILLVAILFVFDASLGNSIQSNKYYYYLSYAFVLCLSIYYAYEITAKFRTTSKANYLFLLIELAIMASQVLFILNYQVNIANNFFRKYDFDMLLWGSLIELITFLIYLFRGIILLNADYLKKSIALSEAQKAIIQTQEAERKIIAQDLHDDLGATLSTLKGSITKIGFSEESQSLLNKAITDLRAISRRLLPADFETYGFVPSLEKFIADINQQQKIKVTFIIFGEIMKLNPEKELNIYRIITELVNNSTKYSNGQNATVQLVYHQDYLFVSIEDDGVVEHKTEDNLGMGLKNINSRLDYLSANPIEIGGQRSYSYVFEIPYGPNL
jgi:signal transduction histidine kinase